MARESTRGALPYNSRNAGNLGVDVGRIRSLKPEFFTSADVVACSPLARILFLATWCEADREGRLVWKPGTIKLRYLPGDECDIDELAGELEDRGMLLRYEVDGANYAVVTGFKRHQMVNKREAVSRLPALTDQDMQRTCMHGNYRGEGKGKEGKGKEGSNTIAQSENRSEPQEPKPESPTAFEIPLNDGTKHHITKADIESYKKLYPAVDVDQECRGMIGWCDADPKRRKTRTGARRFVNGWLARVQNRGGATSNRQEQPKPSGSHLPVPPEVRTKFDTEMQRLKDREPNDVTC